MIKVHYCSIDGVHKMKRCQTLREAQLWAINWVGQYPEVGSHYAVSGDGVGKVTVEGASITDLFPQT